MEEKEKNPEAITAVQKIVDYLDYIIGELENGERLENQDIQFLKDLKDKVFNTLLNKVLSV